MRPTVNSDLHVESIPDISGSASHAPTSDEICALPLYLYVVWIVPKRKMVENESDEMRRRPVCKSRAGRAKTVRVALPGPAWKNEEIALRFDGDRQRGETPETERSETNRPTDRPTFSLFTHSRCGHNENLNCFETAVYRQVSHLADSKPRQIKNKIYFCA